MKQVSRWIARHPWPVIAVNLLLTVFLTYQLRNMHMDPDVTNALPQDLPVKRLYDKMGEIFPSREFVFVGITGGDLFTSGHIRTVSILTDSLEQFPSVQQVMSPTNISLIEGTPEGMEVREILNSVPESQEDIQRYRRDLFGSDLALGNLISEDREAFGIMIFIKNTADPSEFVEELIPFVEEFDQGTDLDLLMAGKPVVNHYVSLGMQRDMGVFFGGGLLVIFLLLLVAFRSVRGI
ncbi:MAG TPA: MMPL family transporter, partial [bacterium]|nr:MMPL family transporter [bacterium]